MCFTGNLQKEARLWIMPGQADDEKARHARPDIDLPALPDREKQFLELQSSLQKGDLFTTETTEITETKDNFIFSQK
jgi:hypothetical protein